MSEIAYGIYGRKSSESDERQIQSLDDQSNICTKLAAVSGLRVIKKFEEAKSAKEPGKRLQFLAMIDALKSGEIQGIVCWKLDRLSRNPDEAGLIIGMLQRGEIKHIKTSERDYFSADNTIIPYMEFGIANQAIRDLSTNVKRGLNSKVEKGWRPGIAPQGYKNTKFAERGSNLILKDEERFPLIRKAWDLMLTGVYSIDEILDKLNNEWGYRTRVGKKRGGVALSRSSLYLIFSNPFYAGFIAYKGSTEIGKHDAMVSIEEFDKVQFLLGKAGKPRPTRYAYAYNGLVRCGECGGFVSATFKEKILKTTGELKTYTLYYCTGARRGQVCSQTYTNGDLIDEQIERKLVGITITPTLYDWALRVLAENSDIETNADTKIKETSQKALEDAQRQLEVLTGLRLREIIEDEEFQVRRGALKSDIARLSAQAIEAEKKEADWVELTAETFRFSLYAHAAFLEGDPKVKREILSTLGLNCTIKDQVLSIEAFPWLIEMEERVPSLLSQLDAFEPALHGSGKREKTAFAVLNPLMRGRRDLNSQPPACT